LNRYDVIVIGAGTGGATAARILASSGFEVCLIDQKNKKKIGEKICGDAIGEHHFKNVGLEHPKGEELERHISGLKIFSPDLKNAFFLVGEGLPGFIINRYLFGQRLLNNALNAGANLFPSTRVLEPIIKNGFVKGVIAKDLKKGLKTEIKAKITIDASGVSAIIRKQLPPELGISLKVNREDFEVCYREIRELKGIIEESDLCKIYINMQASPGGYYWIFPKKEKVVNVGLGVAGYKGFPNPKKQLYEHVISKPIFKDSRIIHEGGGIVPARRPIDSFVGNGIVIVGDAACMVNPIHGGGIGPSMLGGIKAGEGIIDALEKGKPDQTHLWQINLNYMKTYGIKQACLDVFRLFLQGLTNEDLNYGLKYKLIREEDLLKASLNGNVHLNVSDATKRVFRGLGRISFLKKLYDMAKLSKNVRMLYTKYPDSPEGMFEWKLQVQNLFKEAKKNFVSQ
jgi:geranylgeranyl reductase family protein